MIRKEESGFKLLVNQVSGGTSKLSSNVNKRLTAQEEAKALEKENKTRDDQLAAATDVAKDRVAKSQVSAGSANEICSLKFDGFERLQVLKNNVADKAAVKAAFEFGPFILKI